MTLHFNKLIAELNQQRSYVFKSCKITVGALPKEWNVSTVFKGVVQPFTRPWIKPAAASNRPMTCTVTPHFPNEREIVEPGSDAIVIKFMEVPANFFITVTTTVGTFYDETPRIVMI